MTFIERLLVQIIQNDPKTAISFHSKRPKFMKKDSQKFITVSRVGPRWPTLDKKDKYYRNMWYYVDWLKKIVTVESYYTCTNSNKISQL